MTKEQIRQIAALRQTADFRFRRYFGETVVIADDPAHRSGLWIHEDGSRGIYSVGGDCIAYSNGFNIPFDAASKMLAP